MNLQAFLSGIEKEKKGDVQKGVQSKPLHEHAIDCISKNALVLDRTNQIKKAPRKLAPHLLADSMSDDLGILIDVRV